MTTDYDELIDAGRVTPVIAAQMEINDRRRTITRRQRNAALTELCPCNSCRAIRGEPLAKLPGLNTISRPMMRPAKRRNRYNPPPP